MAKKLNLREYWDEVGTENMMKIIKGCKSSLRYFRAMRYGLKRCSEERAEKIVALAKKHTPGFAPDVELLIAGVPRDVEHKQPRRHNMPGERYILPSKRFMASTQPRK